MKKTIYIALLFCLTALTAQSQTSSMAQITMPYQISKTIVREHVYPATISYVETSVMHCFVYDDSFGNITTVSIDSDFSVNDFVVEEDQLYFCGCYKGISGFIGQIDISDFFWGSLHYEIFPDSYISSTEDVATLTKLVKYNGGTYLHLLAIGETSLGASCVEDLYYYIPTSTWHYQVGVLPLATGEKLMDVAVSASSVVTAGLCRTSDKQVYIRAASTNNPFFASTLNQYELVDFGENYRHKKDEIALAVIDTNANIFAVATIWKYNTIDTVGVQLATTEKGVFMNPFYVAAYQQVFPYLASVVYVPDSIGGWSLQGLTRSFSTQDHFFLLHESQPFFGSPVQSIVSDFSWNAIASSTGIPFWTSDEAQFQSIDRYNNGSQYVINGINSAASAIMNNGIGSVGENYCMENGEFQNESVNMYQITHTDVQFVVYGPIATSQHTYLGEEEELQKNVKCKE